MEQRGFYVPWTRDWVETTNKGDPLLVMAWLSNNNTGWPCTCTRMADVIHWPTTHGPGGLGPPQPETTHCGGIVVTGMPLTVTRGTGAVGNAMPP